MQIIKVEKLKNGSHLSQSWDSNVVIPDGWAIIPKNIEIPDSFPFVDILCENGIVTKMTGDKSIPDNNVSSGNIIFDAYYYALDSDFRLSILELLGGVSNDL